MVRFNIYRVKALIFAAAITLFSCSSGCYLKQQERIIQEFSDNKESFVDVAEYMKSFDWENSKVSMFNITEAGPDDSALESKRKAAGQPTYNSTQKNAAAQVFNLGYWTVGRSRSANDYSTIVFEMSGYEPLLKTYRIKGIAYVIGNSEPKPTLFLDTAIDEIVDLGDGWYYWHGVRYPGKLDKGKKPIVFDE